jgi:preprotein translocase subunit SecG
MLDILPPILLAIHIMLAAALIGVVLLQRSEGGLGGLGGGGMSGFMTSRGSANLLTKTTRWLAGAFMATSLILAWLATEARAPRSIVTPEAPTTEIPSTPTEQPPGGGTSSPAPSGSASVPAPTAPSVPTNQ